MKILLLPSWYPTEENLLDGIFFKEQAEALVNNGVEVVVLSIKLVSLSMIGKNTLRKGLSITEENGVKVYRYTTYNYFPKLTNLYLKFYGKIVKKLINKIINEEKGISLVHIHSAIDAGIAYNISKVELPYVITEHSTKYERGILNNVQ